MTTPISQARQVILRVNRRDCCHVRLILYYNLSFLYSLFHLSLSQLLSVNMVAEPLNKKRKLQVNNSVTKQPSFTDVLQQLEAEGDDAGGEQLAQPQEVPKLMNQTPSRRMLHGQDPPFQDLTTPKAQSVSQLTIAFQVELINQHFNRLI